MTRSPKEWYTSKPRNFRDPHFRFFEKVGAPKFQSACHNGVFRAAPLELQPSARTPRATATHQRPVSQILKTTDPNTKIADFTQSTRIKSPTSCFASKTLRQRVPKMLGWESLHICLHNVRPPRVLRTMPVYVLHAPTRTARRDICIPHRLARATIR